MRDQIKKMAESMNIWIIESQWEAYMFFPFRNLNTSFSGFDRLENRTVIWVDPGETVPFSQETATESMLYLAGLHELGHAFHRHNNENRDRDQLQKEEEAWEYALENAETEPSSEDMAYVMQCYWTYVMRFMPEHNPFLGMSAEEIRGY